MPRAAVLFAVPQAACVYAVDVSPSALHYARHNASACGFERTVKPLLGSWFQPLQAPVGEGGAGLGPGSLGGVLSNPPYIPRCDPPCAPPMRCMQCSGLCALNCKATASPTATAPCHRWLFQH